MGIFHVDVPQQLIFKLFEPCKVKFVSDDDL